MDLCSARTEAKRRPACCVRIINHRGREVRPYPQKLLSYCLYYGFNSTQKAAPSKLDKQFILRSKKETYGYSCLTNQKQYYMENYPKIAIEKGTIDEVITMMIRGTEQ